MSETEEKKVFSSTMTSTPPVSPRRSFKAELVERPASPEINCAICLEELRNKSYTNTCLHQFCFHCLLEWSKVKPECPLCKQNFSRIYHNIKSNEEYDEHVLEPPMPPPPLDPHIFINVAFQRHRFRYRSTMGGSMMWAIQGIDPMSMSTSWTPNHYNPIDYSVAPPSARPTRQGATTTRSVTRSLERRLDSSAFRRNVYRQGLWVRPGSASRFRDCSPEFYRINPAQTHRLVPWLTRELNVLLDMQYDTHTVCQDILNLISAHHINSSVFHRAMTFYLGSTAEHFIHEFYHFAISPHDVDVYDSNAQYAQVGGEYSSESDSDIEMLNLPEPLVSLDLTAAPGPSGLQPITSGATTPSSSIVHQVAATSGGLGAEASLNSAAPIIVIELSDEEGERIVEADSDVEIIGQLPPRHLRTPEVITIESDSDIATEGDSRNVEPETKPQQPLIYANISSGEEDGENEIDDEPHVIHVENSATFQGTAGADPFLCRCPMYDNCPYSREITSRRMQQQQQHHNKRAHSNAATSAPTSHSNTVVTSSFKRETITPSTSLSITSSTSSNSTSSSTSSHFTDLDDDLDNSSGSRAGSSRHNRRRKTLSVSKKKTCKFTSGSGYKSFCRKRKRSNHHSVDDSLSADECVSSSTTDDSSGKDTKKKRARARPRLKSIVLKVDKSAKPSTSNAVRYTIRRHTSIKDSTSTESDTN